MRNYMEEYYNGDEAKSIISDASDEIADLRSANADLKRQLEESTIGFNRHRVLLDDALCKIESVEQQLAESQAREARLREALENYKILCQDENHYLHYVDALKALAIPHDDTALREYRDAVIEECANQIDDKANPKLYFRVAADAILKLK